MKKFLLSTMLCAMVILTGCNKQEELKLPQSIQTYQTLNLTEEQNQQVSQLRETQRIKIEEIRKKMEEKRKAYVEFQNGKDISDPKVNEAREKYRLEVNELSIALNSERVAYDKAFLNILDDKQKKIYQKYLKQKDQEKEQRLKELSKNRPLK